MQEQVCICYVCLNEPGYSPKAWNTGNMVLMQAAPQEQNANKTSVHYHTVLQQETWCDVC